MHWLPFVMNKWYHLISLKQWDDDFLPNNMLAFLNEQNHLISEEMGWWYFTQQYVGSLLINKGLLITFDVALNGMTTKKVTTTKCWSLLLMLTFNTYTQKNTTRSWLKSINKITAFLTITNKMRFDLMLMYIHDHSCVNVHPWPFLWTQH